MILNKKEGKLFEMSEVGLKISILLLITALSNSFTSFAQETPLYLIVTSDRLFEGLRNEKGDTIIPAQFKYFGEFADGEEVKSQIVDLIGLPTGVYYNFDLSHPAQTMYTTFDREGNVLYHPCSFDNGPDYIQEGARRFVDIKTGKMGFVHPAGEVIIPAEYDYLTPMVNGYTTAYNGVVRELLDGGEHWVIQPKSGAYFQRSVLNREGKVIKGNPVKKNILDVFNAEDSLYYPLYYRKLDAEEAMISSLNSNKNVKEFLMLDYELSTLNIFDRPSKSFPFFVLGETASWTDYLLVDEYENIYYYDYKSPPIPLNEYLSSYKVSVGE